ncbi:MAG: RNA 2',3'-cyclic phosphodiesterase [Gemmatimonadales bacterium]|nr:RNA 2',3'-cyclic phosphodiesterase [Gemmatimonadales bacterium]MBA3555871.1 RNA 2',3'-cyclic phosphodiesterase [Gemmatimonadales bacterium]
MRLFAAVPLPEPARAEVAGLLDRLRRRELPVRWVRDEGLHLTLKFFGEVAAERVGAVEEAIRLANEGSEPLAMRLDDLGAFPTASRARVLWVGVEAPPALELLQDRLERRCEAIGFPPEGSPFRPHITLGRVRDGERCALEAVEEAAAPVEPLPFLATDMVLYESVRGRGKPRYEPRLTVELGR